MCPSSPPPLPVFVRSSTIASLFTTTTGGAIWSSTSASRRLTVEPALLPPICTVRAGCRHARQTMNRRWRRGTARNWCRGRQEGGGGAHVDKDQSRIPGEGQEGCFIADAVHDPQLHHPRGYAWFQPSPCFREGLRRTVEADDAALWAHGPRKPRRALTIRGADLDHPAPCPRLTVGERAECVRIPREQHHRPVRVVEATKAARQPHAFCFGPDGSLERPH